MGIVFVELNTQYHVNDDTPTEKVYQINHWMKPSDLPDNY